MSLAVGVVLFSAAVILFAWGFSQHRRPVPARWTASGFLSSSFTLVIVAMVTAGIGPIVFAAFNPADTWGSLSLPGVAAMAVAAVLAALLAPRLIRSARPAATGPSTPEVPTPANQPKAPRRRAA